MATTELHKLGGMLDMNTELDALLRVADDPVEDLVEVELEDNSCTDSEHNGLKDGGSSDAGDTTASEELSPQEARAGEHGIGRRDNGAGRASSDSVATAPPEEWSKPEYEDEDETTECETDDDAPAVDEFQATT